MSYDFDFYLYIIQNAYIVAHAIKNQRVAVRYIQSLRVRNTRIQMCGIVEVNEILATRLKSIGSKFHFFPPWFFNVVSSVLIRN